MSDESRPVIGMNFILNHKDAGQPPRRESHHWPQKRQLLGVPLSVTDYEEAVKTVISAARARRAACVSGLAVHGVVTAHQNRDYREIVSHFDLLACDGHPVRVGMNLLNGLQMRDRVAGTDLVEKLCRAAESNQIPIYLYGSEPRVSQMLTYKLKELYPMLRIVGNEPSLFRSLNESEMSDLAQRIERSEARIVFLGLGCPLQEQFAAQLHKKVHVVILCCGAAFDFLSNNKLRAPRWMQKSALEWLFRLVTEPYRLSGRYLYTNSIFLWLVLSDLFRRYWGKKLSP